ncbi:hypothetical protein [Pseudomonas rhodesiae]|uniref:Uncharacterized protein n=1 Tax=Pseudomonas rhodesiae TaxID=76760 RepID=A0AAE8HBC9_9PSED|nr:hypothetical protein [Pseudomonas rhodesiae]TWR53548.1 hypothetical protein FIV35_17670 [Pseudomonas rhodesiae]SDU97697.1 hypothetical protein SAMN04490209_1397 [Pseudomonas rhodesiae]
MRERRTVYHHQGYRLRSYTELLWARVLEAADIFYLYEPDLVRVDDGFYLPDFWLPNVGIYVEVKGDWPTEEEVRKADAVMARTGCEVVFLCGKPESDMESLINCGMYARGANGWHSNISPSDLHRLVRDHVGLAAWGLIRASVQSDDMDWVRPVGHIIEEFFLKQADRSDMEKVLRSTHAEANSDRLAIAREISTCERGLKWFLDRQEFRKSQRAAA